MVIKSKTCFSKSIWQKEEKKFRKLEEKIRIPDRFLNEVDCVILKEEGDFDCIPRTGGCYWIWTNEPVKHRFHKNKIPGKINKGEIIYNGIVEDNIQGRVKHHLFGDMKATWSGISLDIYFGKSRSHRKKIFSTNKRVKVPYVVGYSNKKNGVNSVKLISIRNRDLIFKLFLSKKEKFFIKSRSQKEYYFRNGINISDPKHRKYLFKVYFITGLKTLYREYIEQKWREKFALPKLCSYSKGR